MMKRTRGFSFIRIAVILFPLLISGCMGREKGRLDEEQDLKLTLKGQDAEPAAYTFDRRFSFVHAIVIENRQGCPSLRFTITSTVRPPAADRLSTQVSFMRTSGID